MKIREKKSLKNGKAAAYAALCFVIVVWGVSPVVNAYAYRYYSAAVSTVAVALVSALSLTVLFVGKFKKLNSQYWKIGGITGFINALAVVLQKIGLQYTTPTKYAFLENLSCVVVPVLAFLWYKKKPSFLKAFACALCLLGTFVLNGANFSGGFKKGELLCALAGFMYGVNIVVTGTYAKKFYAPLYVMIQMWIETVVSIAAVLLVHKLPFGESFLFSWNVRGLVLLAGIALIANVLCWTIRTNAMRYVDSTVVAVMMPFSAVVTTLASVLSGTDSLTGSLVVGGVITLVAVLLSTVADKRETKSTQ